MNTFKHWKLLNKVILNSIKYLTENKFNTFLSDKELDDLYEKSYTQMYDKLYNVITTNKAFTSLSDNELEYELNNIANRAIKESSKKINIIKK